MKYIIYGIILSALVYCKNSSAQDKANTVFFIVEEMPTFPGGDEALRKFISENIVYPKSAYAKGLEDRVYVRFIVMEDGHIDSVKIAKGKVPVLNNEAIRVIKKLPDWVPGKQDGKTVRVSYTIPINFEITYNNYIVTTKNDTIHGKLSGFFTTPYKNCDVTVKNDKLKKRYTVDQIKTLSYNHEKYLPIPNDPTKAKNKKIVFMRVMFAEGDYMVLEKHVPQGGYEKIEDDKEYHISSGPGGAVRHYRYLFKGSQYISEYNKKNYKKIIDKYFSSCNRFAREVKYNSKLRFGAIENLYRKYCN